MWKKSRVLNIFQIGRWKMEVDTGTGPAEFLAGMGVRNRTGSTVHSNRWLLLYYFTLVTTLPQIHAETYFTPLYVFIRLVEMLP
jgi:hypothetical protein